MKANPRMSDEYKLEFLDNGKPRSALYATLLRALERARGMN